MTTLYKIRIKLPERFDRENALLLSEGLLDDALSGSLMKSGKGQNAPWVIEWLLGEKPDLNDIIARLSLQAAIFNISDLAQIKPDHFEIEEIDKDQNWLEKSYAGFKPFSIGSLFIHGAHFDGEKPKDKTCLQIDAATAFGSGEHETTRGCLLALLNLKEQNFLPDNILDMGTGSGILAIAAFKMWSVPVMAVDNDPQSICVTKRHAQMNNVDLCSSALSTAVGDGFMTDELSNSKKFDMVLANILAGPVIEMASSLAHSLNKGGYCVLSGMLVEQSDLVLSAYEGEDMKYCSRFDIGEWTTLVMQKT